MQHRLAPDFILDALASGKKNGRFQGTAMFLDVSGFSTIMDTLMQHGQHGSEIMALLMRSLFVPLVEQVYAHNGYIVGFAGDAFTAVFADEDHTPTSQLPQSALSALAAAQNIQAHLHEHDQYTTKYGRFQIGAKIGLAYGEIEWGILQAQNNKRGTFYYKGVAIQGSSDAEHYAARKDIVLHPTLSNLFDPHVEGTFQEAYLSVTAVNISLPPAKNKIDLPMQAPELVSLFFPAKLVTQTVTGEFRQILNLFINLKGTPTPETLAEFMETVFSLQDRYGGLLNRIDFGDKGCHLLFFWGAPTSFENDLSRVLRFVQELKIKTSLPMRMGITYRIAHAGFIGSELHEEYTCYGRGVNLAARFMTNANWGDIWVDAEIAERTRHLFRFEPLGEQTFKGFSQAQKVYQLLGHRQIAQTPFYKGQLVGRDEELMRLHQFAQPLLNGRFPGVAVVIGEAGIGKSRLLHSYLETEEVFNKAKVFLCQADEITRQSLNPFRYWLRDYFDQSSTTDDLNNKEAFIGILNNLIENTTDSAIKSELDRTHSFLGALLGLQWPDSLYEKLEPRLRFENSLTALKALIKAESARQPIILQIEDLQWMDEDSWGFLKRLTRNIEDTPLLILITSREPFPPDALDDTVPLHQIQLENLKPTNITQLVTEKVGQTPHPQFLEWLIQRTEGNPFFIEQMLLYLEENNLLAQTESQLNQLKSSNLLPTDVRSVLTARLDQLPVNVKEAVQTASVLGREFDKPVMAEMLIGQEDINTTLQTGTDESIWVVLSQIRYLFRHMLLRDAAYEMQVHSRLKFLHKQAAKAFEKVYSHDLAPFFEQIAYHYDQAMNTVKAVTYYERAADQARENYQNESALEHYNRALTLTKSRNSETLYRLLSGKEAILNWLGKREEQAAVLEQLDALEVVKGTVFKQSEVALRKAALALSIGQYDRAIEAAQRSAETAVFAQDPLAEARAYHRIGRAHWSQGHYQKARPILKKSQALLQNIGNQKEHAQNLYDLSIIDYYESQFDSALEKLDEALAINEAIQNKQGLITCLSMNGLVHSAKGNHEKTQEQLTLALTYCREVGWRFGEVRTLTQIGNSFFELGNYEKSEQYHQNAQTIYREINDREGQSGSLDTLGLIMYFRGELETAVVYLQSALALDELTNNQRNLAYALTHLGYVHIAQQRFSDAKKVLDEALLIRKNLNTHGVEIDTLSGFALMAYEMNDINAAHHYVNIITHYLESNGTSGIELPIFTYLICYRVLNIVAKHDATYRPIAENLRAEGLTHLHARANEIQNEQLRAQFLQNVPYHKEFLALS